MVVTLPQLYIFLLILARVAGIFFEAPLFSARTFPSLAKTALAVWISLVLWSTVPGPVPVFDGAAIFALFLVKEFIIGFTIGFVAQVIFAAVQAAGDIIDLQTGMSIATIMDPTTGGISTIVGRLTFFIAIVVFLIVNGHHLILAGLHNSFKALPMAAPINLSGAFISQVLEIGTTFWFIAIQLAIPAILLIFLSDFAFGIVSRVAPQVNVFMLGFQVKPSLGLIAILLSLPLLIGHISQLVEQMGGEIFKLFVYLR